MRIKLLALFILALICGISTQAQNTLVSATVTDSGAVVWANGTYTFNFIPNPRLANGPYFNNGVPFTPVPITGTLSGTGTLTNVSVPSNTTITPSGSTWTVTYCPQANAACQTSLQMTISGGSQNITGNFTPTAIVVGAEVGVAVYSTAEAPSAQLGAQIYLLGTGFQICTAVSGNACTTWTPVSGSTPTVTTNPVTCTVGQTFFNTVTGQFLLCISTNVISTASGSPATTIDMKQFGVVADLRTCQGTAGGTTNGSPTFTCTTGAFCNAGAVACPAGQGTDVGKRINGTGACCNLSPPVSSNSQIIPNNCTILSVQSATSLTMSCNATATETANNGLFVFWATDDDAAVTLADTAYVNAPVCTALLWPATPFLVKNPHFNTAPASCESLEHGGIVGNRVPYSSYIGWGSSNSVMYLDASLNANTACPLGASAGCFFSQGANASVHIQHIGISGGWNQVPNGGGHSYVLINLGQSADVIDMRAVGFSAGDGTTIGLQTSSFSNFIDTYFSGFGNTALFNTGASNVFRGGEFSNVNGICAVMGGSANVAPVLTYGMSFGLCTGATVQISGGPWVSSGDLVYGNSANGTCVWVVSAGAQANITGGIIGSNGNCSNNGILVASTGTATLTDTQVNATTNAVNVSASGGKFVDHCGNKYTGTLGVTAGAIIVPCPFTLGSTFGAAPAAGLLNCAISSASPAACGGFSTGSVAVPTAATTYTVNSTTVTVNSIITVNQATDTLTGTKLGVTCNTTPSAVLPIITTRVTGTSFTFSLTAPVTNPDCFDFRIQN